MTKKYRAYIEYTLEPNEKGVFEWEDEDDPGRTPDELIAFTRDEMYEVIMNGVKYNDIWGMIDVEVIDE